VLVALNSTKAAQNGPGDVSEAAEHNDMFTNDLAGLAFTQSAWNAEAAAHVDGKPTAATESRQVIADCHRGVAGTSAQRPCAPSCSGGVG
jgi:hypothetical protein